MHALVVPMMTLLLCVNDSSVYAEDEVILDSNRCTIRVVSAWNVNPIDAREEVRRSYLAQLTRLVTHRDASELSPNDVDQIQRRARTYMVEYDESHEERPRAYGNVYRTTLSAWCPIQAIHDLELEWQSRRRRKFWGISMLILVAPLLLAGVVTTFVRLDRRFLGDRRWLLASMGLIAILSSGATVYRIWQLL